MSQSKLLTIVTESVLESTIVKEIEKFGAHGYTITDARGKGDTGLRNSEWSYNSNIRIEVICSAEVAKKLSEHLQEQYYEAYAMISFSHDVEVLRNNKF